MAPARGATNSKFYTTPGDTTGYGLRAVALVSGIVINGAVPSHVNPCSSRHDRAEERYAFALRASALATPRMRAFARLIASPAVARVVAPLPGYRLDAGTRPARERAPAP